jgi:hypothetical protein
MTVRVKFEYDMHSGFLRVGEGPGDYHISLLCDDQGVAREHHTALICDDLWDEYERCIRRLNSLLTEIREHYDGRPIPLSDEERAQAEAAWHRLNGEVPTCGLCPRHPCICPPM